MGSNETNYLQELELFGGKHFYFYISELEYENQPVMPPRTVSLRFLLVDQTMIISKKLKAMWGDVKELITTKSTNGNVCLF